MKSQEQIRNEVRSFTKNLVTEMRDHAIASGLVDSNFDIKLRMANSAKQQISRGGIKSEVKRGRYNVNGYVSMKLGAYMGMRFHDNDPCEKRHIEYEHIQNDPVIGALGLTSWHKGLAALIAHEVAHAIEHYRAYVMNDRIKLPENAMEKAHSTAILKPSARRGHGAEWQYVYAKLRKAYVNNDAYLDVLNGKVAKAETKTKRKVSKANKRFDVERINRNNVRWMIYRNPRTREVLGIVKATGNFLAFDANGDYVGVFGRAVEARNFLLDRAGV